MVFGRKLLYTFPWEPKFDVTTRNYFMLPIWVEIHFFSLALEGAKYKLVEILGEVLLYIRAMKEALTQMIRLALFGTKRGDSTKHPSLTVQNNLDLETSHL